MKLDHFGFLAPYYERFIQPRPPDQLMSLLKPPSAGTILDAGGGTGRVAQYLVQKTSMIIVGDESMKMLRQAQTRQDLNPVCLPTEVLPFAEDSFDRVMMVDAFHHVRDQEQTAAELWRVLKPGGRLVIEEPDIRTFAVKLVALAEKLALMRSHICSADEISAFFHHPEAVIRVEAFNNTIWVVVDKNVNTVK